MRKMPGRAFFLNYKDAYQRAFFFGLTDDGFDFSELLTVPKTAKRGLSEKCQKMFQDRLNVFLTWPRVYKKSWTCFWIRGFVALDPMRWNRSIFLNACSFAFLFSEDEVLFHEGIHLLRQRVQGEPVFEESLVAYFQEKSLFTYLSTSLASKLRLYLALLLLLCFFALQASLLSAWFLPFLHFFLVLGTFFLFAKGFECRACLMRFEKKITPFLREGKKSKELLLRLSETEIRLLSNLSLSQIKKLIMNWSQTQQRWKIYFENFFL